MNKKTHEDWILFLLICLSNMFCFSQTNFDSLSQKDFDSLFEKFHTNKEFRQQYYDLKRIINFDSISKDDLSFLIENISKEYYVDQLVKEKENILTEVRQRGEDSRKIIFYITILLLILLYVSAFYYRRNERYKKHFKDLIKNQEENNISKSNTNTLQEKNVIPQKVYSDILNKLEIFEKENHFLTKDLTLNSLAKTFNTNISYLSKIVNHNKGQSFTSYLTNLRIDYAVKRLKTDQVFRKYTIKAISEDVGFKTSESFAKAFYKNTGIRPSYYIKALRKLDE